MASYLRPRRGKKATALSQNITLKAGEVFFETPTTGVGTGAGRIMMGNGSNNYTYLNNNKKAFITDINCPDCYISNFTATAGNTTLSNNDTYLNNMKPGATASTFFTNLWTLLSSHNKQLTQLNNDLSNKKLYVKEISVTSDTAGRVPISFNIIPFSACCISIQNLTANTIVFTSLRYNNSYWYCALLSDVDFIRFEKTTVKCRISYWN